VTKFGEILIKFSFGKKKIKKRIFSAIMHHFTKKEEGCLLGMIAFLFTSSL
jgi:hypothetical protein